MAQDRLTYLSLLAIECDVTRFFDIENIIDVVFVRSECEENKIVLFYYMMINVQRLVKLFLNIWSAI